MLAVALALATAGFALAHAGIKGDHWRDPWAPFVEWLGGKPAEQNAAGGDIPFGPGLDAHGNPIPGVVPQATAPAPPPVAGITGFVPPGIPGRMPTV